MKYNINYYKYFLNMQHVFSLRAQIYQLSPLYQFIFLFNSETNYCWLGKYSYPFIVNELNSKKTNNKITIEEKLSVSMI